MWWVQVWWVQVCGCMGLLCMSALDMHTVHSFRCEYQFSGIYVSAFCNYSQIVTTVSLADENGFQLT